MKTPKIIVRNPEIFCRLLAMRGPLAPRVREFAWEGDEGRIIYGPSSHAFPEDLVLEGWDHFGFQFSRGVRSGSENLPDICAVPGAGTVYISTGIKSESGLRRPAAAPSPSRSAGLGLPGTA